MRIVVLPIAAMVFIAPSVASAAISCSQIPDAQRFVDNLRPGPNTRAAQRHLDAAKRATSDGQCIAELRQVDKYARRSAAADRRTASLVQKTQADGPRIVRRVRCADALHQDRPGGSDYNGPPVAGCPSVR